MRTDFYHARNGEVSITAKFKRTLKSLKKRGVHVPKGTRNFTVCRISDNDGRTLAIGRAFCSGGDNFSKIVGRELSELRALDNLPSLSGHIDHIEARKRSIVDAIHSREQVIEEKQVARQAHVKAAAKEAKRLYA